MIDGKKIDRIKRVDCRKNSRLMDNRPASQHANRREPDNHYRAENPTYESGSLFLNEKEGDEYQAGHRHHIGGCGIGGHIEAFDRRQYRYGRGDYPIAVKKGRTNGSKESEQSPKLRVVFQFAA